MSTVGELARLSTQEEQDKQLHLGIPLWNFMIEYLGEIETDLENKLICLSGAQMALIDGQN